MGSCRGTSAASHVAAVGGAAVCCMFVCMLGVFAADESAGVGGTGIDYYECSPGNRTTVMDKELTQTALNLEYFEAEYFLWGSKGYGLDVVAPYLVDGGPPPIGAQKANLDAYYTDIFYQMGLQEVGHVRAIKRALGDPPRCAFPRTLINVSTKTWADLMDKAWILTHGEPLSPPFDPYADSLKYLISTYTIPYVGLTGYVGTNPLLNGYNAKDLVAKLLAIEAGQDAIIRDEMYRQKDNLVPPYTYTVADFSTAISNLRNNLSHALVDEGLVVPEELGAEMMVSGNILSAGNDSLAYPRTNEQVLATVYGTGDPSQPGGFFPKGAQGVIAAALLNADN